MKYIAQYCLILLVSLAFQNCSSSEGPPVCTTEFVMHPVTVLNPAGEPADSVDINIRSKATGEEYACGEYLCNELETGNYVIMHDGLKEKFSSREQTFIVSGTKDSLQFRQEYVFRNGVCHVTKIAGPDTVSLEKNP